MSLSFPHEKGKSATLSFSTPVMFTEKEKAGVSNSLWFTHLAIVFVELGQLDIHGQFI
jgi:hypothetical protein